jgi:hypothetical protein
VQGLEGEVLELPLDLEDPQAMRERRVDLERLGRLRLLLRPGEDPERSHVVQSVGQLDDQHPDVARHRHDHLADVLGLLLLARAVLDLVELRHPVHESGHLVAELSLDDLQAHVGVLDDVVEERRDER